MDNTHNKLCVLCDSISSMKQTKEVFNMKHRVRRQTKKAIKNGEIIRPTLCQGCGRKKVLEAHHEDYSDHKKVQFLCQACHTLADHPNIQKSRTEKILADALKKERKNIIIATFKAGYNYSQLAFIFNIHHTTIIRILKKK